MPGEMQTIEKVVNRIVQAVQPLQIILFGSAARDEMGPDSDLDVLVVMPDGTHRLQTMRLLYRQMAGVGFPVDIVVTTPHQLEEHRNNMGLIYHTVLTEGKEVYAA